MQSELTVVGGGGPPDDWVRPPITDEDERTSAEQLLTVILSNLQRERGSAEIFYVRARNLIAFATALFVGMQAAFVASIGRQSAGQPLVNPDWQDRIAIAAGAGLVCVLVAAVILAFAIDRPRKHRAVTGEELLDLWLDPTPGPETELPFLMVMLRKLSDEESQITEANRSRAVAGWWLASFVIAAIGCVLTELVLLYLAMR